MKEIFVTPFLLGLSSGIYCLTYCIPFIAPIIVSEARPQRQDFAVISRFLLGRLFGYLCFGAFFGYLGASIQSTTIDLIVSFCLGLLSLALIAHALGLVRGDRSLACAKIKKYNPQIPFLMGFLMGVNVCPPFLMSLSYIFTLHNALAGMVYFLMFFLATSLYFLPLVFLGFLNERKEFQWAGRVSALIIGSAFLVYSFNTILNFL